jgi:uncharacterized protein YnzC (UPF0291/DUF896 family)
MINKTLSVIDNRVIVSLKTKKSGLVTARVVNGIHGYDIVDMKAERDITDDRLKSIRDSLRQWYLSQYKGQHDHML